MAAALELDYAMTHLASKDPTLSLKAGSDSSFAFSVESVYDFPSASSANPTSYRKVTNVVISPDFVVISP